MLRYRERYKRRGYRESGISLMYVIVVGGITASAALALGSSLFPVYNHVSSLAVRGDAVDISENTLRYAMAKYAQSALNSEDLQTITADKLSPPDAIKNNATVTVSLQDADNNTLQNNGVFAQTDYTFPTVGYITPSYKLLTITTTKGTYTHTLRVLLKPSYTDFPNYVSTDGGSGGGSTVQPQAMFAGALQANTNLRVGDGINVAMEGGAKTGANIGSNSLVTLDGTTTINGNINAFTPTAPTTPTSIKATTNATVMGNVSASGNIVNVDSSITGSPLTSDATGGNVWGDGNFGPSPTPGTLDNKSSATTLPPVTTPQPSQDALISGSINQPTSISMSSNANANSVVDLGNLKVSSGQTVSISPGNYVVNSITVEDGGVLTVKSSPSDPSTGVNLYVQGKGDTPTPIDIQGNVNFSGTTPSPNNFQMFYSGQKPLNISTANGSNMYALVYAPNSSIGLGLGGNSNFHGALVGDSVSVVKNSGAPADSTANFVYDSNATSLSPPSSSGAAPAPHFTPPQASASGGYAVKSYRIISWEEPVK